jgi:uncharacterized Zn-finger protein
VHVRTHTGERPFVCSFEGCDYACSKSGHLRTHIRTHTGERPFTCVCGAAYTSSRSLRRHVERCHGEDLQQQQQQQDQKDEREPDEAQHAADCDAVVDFIREQLQGLSDVEWVTSDAEEEEQKEEDAEDEDEELC